MAVLRLFLECLDSRRRWRLLGTQDVFQNKLPPLHRRRPGRVSGATLPSGRSPESEHRLAECPRATTRRNCLAQRCPGCHSGVPGRSLTNVKSASRNSSTLRSSSWIVRKEELWSLRASPPAAMGRSQEKGWVGSDFIQLARQPLMGEVLSQCAGPAIPQHSQDLCSKSLHLGGENLPRPA